MAKQKQQASKQQPASPPRRFPLWAGVAGIVLVVSAAIFWFAWGARPTAPYTPEVTGGPSAQLDQTVFDYGDVKLGTTIKTLFRVKNVGDAQLAFQGVPRIEVREGC